MGKKEAQALRQGVAMGATHPSPHFLPTGRKVRPERVEDELTKRKERQRLIFSSNLSTYAAFHSVENISKVVDHLKLCSCY